MWLLRAVIIFQKAAESSHTMHQKQTNSWVVKWRLWFDWVRPKCIEKSNVNAEQSLIIT